MLLCPRGEGGWNTEMYRVSDAAPSRTVPLPGEFIAGARRKRKKISVLDWSAFYLAVRGDNTPEENPLHCCRRGFAEWCCECFALYEEERLRFLRSDELQNQLRRTSFDHIMRGDAQTGAEIGQRVILPSTHAGSPRNMYMRYADAMALVRKYGKPTFFITFTCNPKWPEIQRELLPGQKPEDRNDITARVFNLKMNELLEDLITQHVLGRTVAHTYVIEYQKRGLPHAHILLIMDPEDLPRTNQEIDACVCAELPDPDVHPQLFNTVTNCMLHGPCGALNPSCPCMDAKTNKCSKHYPKPFVEETTMGDATRAVGRVAPGCRRLSGGCRR